MTETICHRSKSTRGDRDRLFKEAPRGEAGVRKEYPYSVAAPEQLYTKKKEVY